MEHKVGIFNKTMVRNITPFGKYNERFKFRRKPSLKGLCIFSDILLIAYYLNFLQLKNNKVCVKF